VPTDPRTLQAKRQATIFALGDATDLPASKAGSVVHFLAEILAPNIRRFNYAVEPVPGRFPFAFGPLSLSRRRCPSRANGPRPRSLQRSPDMPTATFLGASIDVDAEGFLEKPEQWNEDIGLEIARQNGLPDPTERHWQVIRFMRDTYLKTGSAPSVRTLGKDSGVPVKELYQLFPNGPAKLAAKIGGIPKPTGCI
jgi:tRNA 2-thiouridine synthesizing protein E